MSIEYWDREKGSIQSERVYGGAWIDAIYGTAVGRTMENLLLSGSTVSRFYGAVQSSPFSRVKIAPFIEKFGIDMTEFEPGPFGSFNDFFVRRFKPGARPFESDRSRLCAPAEARYLAFDRTDSAQTFPVKGSDLTAAALLGGADRAAPFVGGPMLIARLCPTDYHRFHFPDAGTVLDRYALHGKLHSVNPAALATRGTIFIENERQVSILKTAALGKIAYVEVGALCVGRIVQTHTALEFARGDEKGCFLFGASTVIILGEPGVWVPDPDLLEQTRARRETFVKLGQSCGRAHL